jgi:hypothetical protein
MSLGCKNIALIMHVFVSGMCVHKMAMTKQNNFLYETNFLKKLFTL